MPQITIKTNAGLVAKDLERLRKHPPLIADARLKKAAEEIKRRMSVAGKRITYPVKWDSLRQKIAYFATDGFTIKGKRPPGYINHHIPYKRTDRHREGWRVTGITQGYRVDNRYRNSKYLYGNTKGTGQSRIHQGRWPVFRKVIDAVVKYLPKTIIRTLQGVLRGRHA